MKTETKGTYYTQRNTGQEYKNSNIPTNPNLPTMSSQAFHCNKCHQDVDSNSPMKENSKFDLIDYLKEAQTREYNEFNNQEHPEPDDLNYQLTNKINEMLVLANLFFFKGSNVYQEVKLREKEMLGYKATIEKQEKIIESNKELEVEIKNLELKNLVNEEIVKKHNDSIESLGLKILSKDKIIKEYEETLKQAEDKSKTINLFVESLQSELKQSKEMNILKEKQIQDSIITKNQLLEELKKENSEKTNLMSLINEYEIQKNRVESPKLRPSLKPKQDYETQKTLLDIVNEYSEPKYDNNDPQQDRTRSPQRPNSPKKNSRTHYETQRTLANDFASPVKQYNETPSRINRQNSPKINRSLSTMNAQSPQHYMKTEEPINFKTKQSVIINSPNKYLQTEEYGYGKSPENKENNYLKTEDAHINNKKIKSMLNENSNSNSKEFKKTNTQNTYNSNDNSFNIQYKRNYSFNNDKLVEDEWTNDSKTFINVSNSFETLSLNNSLKGNFKCVFKLIKMSYGLHLGVSTRKVEFSEMKSREFLGKLNGEYAINLYSGYLWKNDKKYQKVIKDFKNGDIIEMTLENGNLYFKCGNDNLFTFKGIFESVYPSATLMRKGDSVELVSIEML